VALLEAGEAAGAERAVHPAGGAGRSAGRARGGTRARFL